MKRRTAKEQALNDDAHLLRTWRKWHREQLEETLNGHTGPRSHGL
jgi:hypothetical protein